MDALDDKTVDVDRPMRLPPWLAFVRRLYASPAAMAVTFALGFLVTFVPGALVFLREPDVAELLAKEQFDEVIAILKRRELAGDMAADDWLAYGHAIDRRYGSFQRDAVLEKYAQAIKLNKTDATALQATIVALGDEKVREQALALLKDWPEPTDPLLAPDRWLAQRVRDESFLVRHGAVDALKKRGAPAEMLFAAAAAAALTDIKAWTCEHDAARVGLQDILEIAKLPDPAAAKQAFAAANPTARLMDIGPPEMVDMPCVGYELVTATRKAVSSLKLGAK